MGIQLPLAMKRSTILFRITDKYERGTIDRKQEENDRIINTGMVIVDKGTFEIAYYVERGSYDSDGKDAVYG